VGYAEVISLPEVRARKQWEALRQQLHERFDQWLDAVEAQLPASEPTLAQVSETIWALRQQLTGGVAQTIIEHTHQEEQRRKALQCATCAHLLRARPTVSRTVETLIGEIKVHRPYFYCPHCHRGRYPLDEVLGLRAGRIQRDVQQAAAALATELPYDTAATLFGHLSGLAVSSERMHTLTNQAAEGLSVLDVAPTRDEIDQRVAQVAAGRWRRPVLVLGIDGAYVPSRPESARGRRPGQARQRARRAQWRHEWREAKGFRFYLLNGDRIVHVLSWHQVQTEYELGEALRHVKEAGVIPEDTVRLCVIGDGAEWIWPHVQALFPHACQVLDYYHCSEYLHKVAKAQYSDQGHALEWVEATFDPSVSGQSGVGAGWSAAHAADVRRSAESD
jgi:AcrR family transcriptional regulator